MYSAISQLQQRKMIFVYNILMSVQESSSAVPFQTADQQVVDGNRFRLMKADTDEVLERQT